LFLYPIVWLLALPFRLVGFTLEGVSRLLAAIILLPARVPRRARGPRGADRAERVGERKLRYRRIQSCS
jgi:hypothetical protein